jgi:hypothetical protein
MMKNTIPSNEIGGHADSIDRKQGCPIKLPLGVARTPEQRLMAAVLLNAINYYVRYAQAVNPRRRWLHADAARWIGNRDTTWPFSFENICAVLHLDAPTLRRQLRATQLGRENGAHQALSATGPGRCAA